MNQDIEGLYSTAIESEREGRELVSKLLRVTEPDTVFSKPISAGDYSVINASAVSVGMGFGYGRGGTLEEEEEIERAQTFVVEEDDEPEAAFGDGGGGGGFSQARPVATITLGPNGVDVTPIVDVTKIGIAILTTLGSMLLMFSKMRRESR
jgi:uncharacterized spore protein YtfJ